MINSPKGLPSVIGDFDAVYIGSETYLLSLRGTKYFTGAAITEYRGLPIPHRLLKLEFKHTDNADPPADSVASWTYQLRRLGINNLYNTLRGAAGVTVSDVIETFDDSFVSGPAMYRFYHTQTTATDRIWPIIFIRAL